MRDAREGDAETLAELERLDGAVRRCPALVHDEQHELGIAQELAREPRPELPGIGDDEIIVCPGAFDDTGHRIRYLFGDLGQGGCFEKVELCRDGDGNATFALRERGELDIEAEPEAHVAEL